MTKSDDEDCVGQAVFLAAHSQVGGGGRLLIDEIKGRANCVRAAVKAKWKPSMVARLEDDLLDSLCLLVERVKWYESGLRGPPPVRD